MNIVLIGFMGTGKSATGKIIAADLKYTFLDTDAQIEATGQRTINQIFASEGEAYFRGLERQVAAKISLLDHTVVATGGGFVLNPDNLRVLRANSVIIALTAEAEVIYERVKIDVNRPLLAVTDPLQRINELLAERSQLYLEADLVFDTSDGGPELQAKKIIEVLYERGYLNGRD
jgi:shikimate kinase